MSDDFVKGGSDWDSNIKNIPSSKVGEFSSAGTNPVPASSIVQEGNTEQRRTPLSS